MEIITPSQVIELLQLKNIRACIGTTTSDRSLSRTIQNILRKIKKRKHLASHTFYMIAPDKISEASFPRFPKEFESLKKYIARGRETKLFRNNRVSSMATFGTRCYCMGRRGALYGCYDYVKMPFKWMKDFENQTDVCSEHTTYIIRQILVLPFIPRQINKSRITPSATETFLESEIAKKEGWEKVLDCDGEFIMIEGITYRLLG